MKLYHKILLCLILASLSANFAKAQQDAEALVKQGVALHDEGKYQEAIEKYKQALAADPKSIKANYEIAYTYFASGKGKEAVPYLEKVLAMHGSYIDNAYDMLGSIYDDDGQPQKAIEYYQSGLKVNPRYQRSYYNLAVTHYRLKNYAEAEANAINAIRLDPSHASSHYIYGQILAKQQKNLNALLTYCMFLAKEPNTDRAVTTLAKVRDIIKGKNGAGSTAGDVAMQSAIYSATTLKSNLSAIDSLTLQLDKIFKTVATPSGITDPNNIVWTYYAPMLNDVATGGHTEAFVRWITMMVNKDETLKWANENKAKLDGLSQWARSPKFEIKNLE